MERTTTSPHLPARSSGAPGVMQRWARLLAGVLAILPYRLYARDVRHATVHAHRIASVVHTALSHAILEGEGWAAFGYIAAEADVARRGR